MKDFIAIFDLDGTLCRISEARQILHMSGDYDNFNRLAEFEPCNYQMVNRLLKHTMTNKIAIVTARPIEFKEITEQWLNKNQIPYDELLMRESGDYRRSWEVKQDHLNELLKKHTVTVAYDDRDQDINMFASNAIATIKVNGGIIE